MTLTKRFQAISAALLLGTAFAGPAFAASQSLSIISNGEKVGSIVANIQGSHVDVDYKVDNNGRGPKHVESLDLGPNDIPRSWSIKGTSLMGGSVEENFAWSSGMARWSGAADSGAIAATKPPLYVVNDTSPWALGVYARALLKAPGHKLAAIPGGQMRLSELEPMQLGSGKTQIRVTAYQLDGTDINPNYLLLDADGQLFATLESTQVTVRTGFEQLAPQLLELASRYELARVKAISEKVAHRFDQPVRIRNVHVFDPRTGTSGPLSTVVTMRDRISLILPGDGGPVPADQAAVDGNGGTIYPGLHDMHYHATLASGLYSLAVGVTSAREMGNDNQFLQNVLEWNRERVLAGPHITANGFIEGRSPFSARYGIIVGSMEEGLAAVRWYADRDYYQVKFYNSMSPALIKPLAAEAHRLGMGVTGHIPAFYTPDQAMVEGYDTIAHLNQLILGWVMKPGEDTRTALRLTAMQRAADLDLSTPAVKRTIGLMKEHGVGLDTTATIIEKLMLSRAGTGYEGSDDFIGHMPIGYQRYLKRTFVPLPDKATDTAYTKAAGKMLELMDLLHRDGIQLLPGTDDAYGFLLPREVELYARSGMGPAAALTAATLECSQYLKRDFETGTIERGKIADLVLVPGDPLKDITLVKHPSMVMHDGAIYYPSEIYEALGVKPFSPRPQVTPPQAPNTGAEGPLVPAISLFGGGHDDLMD